jgi:hypothetical protein
VPPVPGLPPGSALPPFPPLPPLPITQALPPRPPLSAPPVPPWPSDGRPCVTWQNQDADSVLIPFNMALAANEKRVSHLIPGTFGTRRPQ